MASSVFVRHTLDALYSDLHVELRRVNVLRPSSHRLMVIQHRNYGAMEYRISGLCSR